MGEWQVLLWCLTVVIGVVGFLRITADELAQAQLRRARCRKYAARAASHEASASSDEPIEATLAADQADAAA